MPLHVDDVGSHAISSKHNSNPAAALLIESKDIEYGRC